MEHERECIQALNDEERCFMATLALQGWTFKLRTAYLADTKWAARPPGHDEPKYYAPTLFSLLGYVERELEDNHDRR